MSLDHVKHSTLVAFAEERVNLSREHAREYREQVVRLREKLQGYVSEHPTFALRKMLLSGSLAKGTALRSINDIDVACYIEGADAPQDVRQLIDYLAQRLRTAFPNFRPDQVQPKTYSVTVSFRGTGLDVDVVPILYDKDPDWFGNLVNQDDGTLLRTCIPRHLEFCRKRKAKAERHFAQVIRLVKFWAKRQKAENTAFRLKSFMVELILAKLQDQGMAFDNYVEALQGFFTYLAARNLREQIAFSDYYPASALPACSDRVRIIDPVNPSNNVSKLYSHSHVALLVNAALEAGDAIDAAIYAPTKADTVRYWQKVFGPTFQP